MSQCMFVRDGVRCGLTHDHPGPCQFPDRGDLPMEASRERCLVTDPGTQYTCSLVPGHAGQHEAWDGHQVGPVGGCLSAWPQETKVGPVNVTTFSELRDLVIELEARETETRLRHAERLDAFAECLRNTAAMAGETLERTKGLQVPEILRRLKNLERNTDWEKGPLSVLVTRVNRLDGRIHDLERNEPEQVQLELPPTHLAVLTSAVTELTTVMRELVQQNTPPEVCGAPDQIGHVTCELEKGHTARHVNGISSWPRETEPRTCPATLRLSNTELGCVLDKGHIGPHQDRDDDNWTVTGS